MSASYILKIIHQGKIQTVHVGGKNKIIHIAVEDQSAYQIFAENGSLLHEPANKQSDDDLWVYLGRKADGAPDLILDNYFQHHPVTDFNYLNQSYFTFATASETEAFIPPTLPSTISPLSATTAINNLSPMTWAGIAALGASTIAAASGLKGNHKGNSDHRY